MQFNYMYSNVQTSTRGGNQNSVDPRLKVYMSCFLSNLKKENMHPNVKFTVIPILNQLNWGITYLNKYSKTKETSMNSY